MQQIRRCEAYALTNGTRRAGGWRRAAAGGLALAVLLGTGPVAEAQRGRTPPANLVPLQVNQDELVEMAVLGHIAAPRMSSPPYRVSPDGTVRAVPGTGSITYNVRVGDSALRMRGDHLEPAVSITTGPSGEQLGLTVLAQIGNRARVVTGAAQGAIGTVVGKHGGIENVMIEFPDEVMEQLVIGDRIQVRAVGLGMEAVNVQEVAVRNMSPQLLAALNSHGMGVTPEGKLRVPVTHRVPAKIMGSGLGANQVHSGDYDIQMFDQQVVEEYGLGNLRLGDIVAIIDADHAHGRIYLGGAVSIGVVSHGGSAVAGHGPGVTTLLPSAAGNIEVVIDSNTNLANLLNLR